jgi:hypothetical protein
MPDIRLSSGQDRLACLSPALAGESAANSGCWLATLLR